MFDNIGTVYYPLSFQKWYFQISDRGKFRKFFLIRVVEIFNLSHWEFSTSQKTTSRSDLISKAKADLGATKRKAAIVILKHSLEIHENTLGRLRSQISQFLASGADHRRKHQIEGFRLFELIPIR